MLSVYAMKWCAAMPDQAADSDELESLTGDPAHWHRGSYRCADDPRLFVPNPAGFGWTLNMAHAKAQVATWSLLAGVVAFVTIVGWWVTRGAA